ncbi:hypothetical protein OG863_39550 [Streptomyces decoyicus]|uniref:Uncharacterized protein n=1 Tax=Streptomyces decoyicus TaxID=249567 RepID=A0ABZ1FVS8_9ACTN|nr:hypothetical protein [Streptomyces decoyicus]WSB73553.1 hypothetical protein OG863_39550 [Streptomyces decoyicus]
MPGWSQPTEVVHKDNNGRAVAVITAFLQDKPAPLPNSPTRDEIPVFLRDHK